MESYEREWKRQTRCFELFLAYQLSRYEGSRALSARLYRKRLELEFQFLPTYFGQVPRWRLFLRRFGGPRASADFACIGTIKGGSSDVSAYLLQHPCLLPTLSKEIPHGFAEDWTPYYPTRKERDRVAAEHGKALCGNFTPWLQSAAYLETFRNACPEGKVIIVLRDPVRRAFSHFKWNLFLGGKRLLRYSFYQSYDAFVRKALELFPEASFPTNAGYPFLASGIYVSAVKRWLDAFGPERVHILRAEDFFEEPVGAIGRVQEFLELPPVPCRSHGIVLRNPVEVPAPAPETTALLQEFYRPWNAQLYDLIGRDMGWAG